jgi:SAM-dependent methyltransferase
MDFRFVRRIPRVEAEMGANFFVHGIGFKHSAMKCRVCDLESATRIGEVEYYSGFEWPIYDCTACGCRFTRHDESVYDWLHRQPQSIYALYRDLVLTTKRLFDKRDLDGLREQLSETSKYKFVIDLIEAAPKTSRVLEVGCSRGQLTAFFILAGYDILGTDVSVEATTDATENFGDFFVTANSPSVFARRPYHIIYHTGMIGCVADPIRTTNELLDLLKPGGRLLFNSPRKDACTPRDQLWIDASPPPDVVTLFAPGFWKKQFRDVADVTETTEILPPERSFSIGLQRVFRRKWNRPQPVSLELSADDYRSRRRSDGLVDWTWNNFERAISRLAVVTGLSKLAPAQPAPFGLFVTMLKK